MYFYSVFYENEINTFSVYAILPILQTRESVYSISIVYKV